MTSCRGCSVPRANHYAYFYISCGLGQYYTVLDLQDFSKDNETDGQEIIGSKRASAEKNDNKKDTKKDMKA